MMGSMTNSSCSDCNMSMQKIRYNNNNNNTTRALFHPLKPVRKVHFNNAVIINEIPTHRVLTSHERLSVWYTKVDYKYFQLEERKKNKKNRFAAGKTFNTLSSSSNSRSSNNPNKLSKSCQQRRIHQIRCMVLIRAQYAYQNLNMQRFDEKNVTTTTSSNSIDGYRDSYYFQQQQRRLAEFYQQHSLPCLQAARERALENEIWNINRKLQEHFQYYQKKMVSHTQAASSCFQHWF
jgi:hypothetical protein